VLQVGGIGYLLHVSLSTYTKLGASQRIKLYTVLHVREDCQRLYGFASEAEREAFELLTSVSSVGPEKALKVLSAVPLDRLRAAVARGDAAALSGVKGVGRKTAERITVELRGKMAATAAEGAPSLGPENVSQAVAGLISLGYTRSESERAVDRAVEAVGAQASLEELIREALRHA
jgi:Holliday junction DNA helicase RuvA